MWYYDMLNLDVGFINMFLFDINNGNKLYGNVNKNCSPQKFCETHSNLGHRSAFFRN